MQPSVSLQEVGRGRCHSRNGEGSVTTEEEIGVMTSQTMLAATRRFGKVEENKREREILPMSPQKK